MLNYWIFYSSLVTRRIFWLVEFSLSLAILLSIAGCREITKWEGAYEGYFQSDYYKKIQKQRVHIQLKKEHLENGRMSIKKEDGTLLSEIPIQLSRGHVDLDLRSLGISPIRVKPEDGCLIYRGREIIRICPNENDFLLDVLSQSGEVLIALSAYRHVDQTMPSLERPAPISFADSRMRVIRFNFENSIALEKKLQARLQARKAYLDLAPRLSYAGIATLLAGDAATVLGAVGDLLPFLFPSRWIQADQTKLLSKAQYDALLLVRANLILQLESLCHALWQTQAFIKAYDLSLGRLQELQVMLSNRQLGTSDARLYQDQLELDLLKLKYDRNILQQAERSLLMGISQTLGFQNPQAVAEITNYSFIMDFDKINQLELSHLSEKVLDRAIELRQIDTLIRAAELSKEALYFSWLDPSSGGLGFGLGASIGITKSQIRELRIQKEQMSSRLLGNLQEILNNVTQWKDSYPLLSKRETIQNRQYQKLLSEFVADAGKDPSDLIQSIISGLDTQSALLSLRSNTSLAFAKLRRLLYDAGYHCLWETCKPSETFLISSAMFPEYIEGELALPRPIPVE